VVGPTRTKLVAISVLPSVAAELRHAFACVHLYPNHLSDLNVARTSSAKIAGCSQAAKCPPFEASFQ
jgi:hypothetical protein